MKPIILGSQSPRRKEILSFFNLPFEQIPSYFDEDSIKFKDNPIEYTAALAKGKAIELHRRYPQETILTADTVVYSNGKSYGKPASKQHAHEMISGLQGKWHSVYTALALVRGHETYEKIEETRVLFNPLTPKEVDLYLQQMQWADKAGGYAIQSSGGLIVRKIDGCFYNVMGLPVNALREILIHVGIDLWERI